MIGLLYLGVFSAYLWFSIWVTKWAVKKAKAREVAGWKYGLPMSLVMYLLVFWDWIPTVVSHKYYCTKEAGFWEYKTVDKFKEENPDVLDSLIKNPGAKSIRKGDMENYTDTYFLNQRFKLVVKHNGKFLFNRWRHEQEIVDLKDGSVLARYIDFSTSLKRPQAGWSGWKIWLRSKHCDDGLYNQDQLRALRNKLMGVE